MEMPPTQLAVVIKDNVKARRKELGLTQVQLAELLECDQALVSQIESGKTGVSIPMLAVLSEALKTTPAALVSESSFSALASA